eukprot:1159494-Pelagomonas_calceolata.AAC.5
MAQLYTARAKDLFFGKRSGIMEKQMTFCKHGYHAGTLTRRSKDHEGKMIHRGADDAVQTWVAHRKNDLWRHRS